MIQPRNVGWWTHVSRTRVPAVFLQSWWGWSWNPFFLLFAQNSNYCFICAILINGCSKSTKSDILRPVGCDSFIAFVLNFSKLGEKIFSASILIEASLYWWFFMTGVVTWSNIIWKLSNIFLMSFWFRVFSKNVFVQLKRPLWLPGKRWFEN